MNATHALGWALVHFFWQGAALALLLGLALASLRPGAARTRYTLSLLTLCGMLVVPIATGLRLFRSSVDLASAPSALTTAAPGTPVSVAANLPAPRQGDEPAAARRTASESQLRGALEPILPWLVVLWVIGVVALSVRLAHGWMTARRLRTTGTREAPVALQQSLVKLAARLRVARPIHLLESLVIEVPAVIGWLRPVVLVPTSALTGLTPQQLDVLLAHELAHVRRYDYVVNLVQCVIETLLFYHPAVWWVSRRVREEREHCCDDLVVAAFGDPHLYASALVDMERVRSTTPRLALAATGGGGSLLYRIQRLLMPHTTRGEYFPRWSAGISGFVAITVALLASGSDRVSGAPSLATVTADTTRLTPDTVLRAPDQSQPLGQRWEWARTQVQRLGKRAYWIGYTIPRPAWLQQSVYVDRGMEVKGRNITISGRMFGDFQGFMFRGVRLAPLTGTPESDDIVLLFGFSVDQSGKPALWHVHVASVYLPVDFRGRTLVWLGNAVDAQSLGLVQDVFAATPQAQLREDLVSAIGVHGESETVVPLLVRLMNGRESNNVRSQAAQWLGFHPTAAAVNALSAAARNDASADVRREAAEALGDNAMPAARESTVSVAKTATDAETRRAAVEALGQQATDQALTALAAIGQNDRDEDVQRAAVEALGDMPDGRGIAAVRDIARNNARAEVRRAAVETLGDKLPAAEAIALLKTVATSDADGDVQREAVEKLGEIAPTPETVQFLSSLLSTARNEDVQRQALETLADMGQTGLTAIIDVARTHARADIRRAAIEAIGDKATPAQAVDVLGQITRRDQDSDVQGAAVETIGNLHSDGAVNLLADLARTHPSSDVRRKAIEALGESGHRDSAIAVLSDLSGSSNADAANAAIEALGDMKGARALAIVARVARKPGNEDVRSKAIETYVDAASSDSALALLKSILASNTPDDITNKVLETLEEMNGGAGIPLLIETARSNPNRNVRADALRRLAESDDPRAKQMLDRTLRQP